MAKVDPFIKEARERQADWCLVCCEWVPLDEKAGHEHITVDEYVGKLLNEGGWR